MKRKLILFAAYFVFLFVTSYFIADDGLPYSLFSGFILALIFTAADNFMTKFVQKYVVKIVTKIVKPRS